MDEQNISHEYRTGRTCPRKSRSGMITALLMCVIFLGGIVSALGLLNIRLFRQLEMTAGGKGVFLSFSREDGAAGEAMSGDQTVSLLAEGMTLQELPSLYQQIYRLPAGLYVCKVAEGSCAADLGIAPGDVLLAFDGTPVTTLDGLQALQSACKTGDRVAVVVYQSGKENTLTLTVE